ncbi:cardiolipin synthase ClsB, partial [Stutzerimonas nitrititolerans]
MKFHWRDGNRLQLLENGEEFFPRVFEAIREAKKEVLLETFIFFEDKVGIELQKALIAAAQRGASVDITVDGYGSADLSAEFVAAMTDVGIRIQMFDPRKRLLGKRVNLFRRLHRKIVVVDGEVAFIGGINFSADHLSDFGPGAKQDYALQVEGPVVHDIH